MHSSRNHMTTCKLFTMNCVYNKSLLTSRKSPYMPGIRVCTAAPAGIHLWNKSRQQRSPRIPMPQQRDLAATRCRNPSPTLETVAGPTQDLLVPPVPQLLAAYRPPLAAAVSLRTHSSTCTRSCRSTPPATLARAGRKRWSLPPSKRSIARCHIKPWCHINSRVPPNPCDKTTNSKHNN